MSKRYNESMFTNNFLAECGRVDPLFFEDAHGSRETVWRNQHRTDRLELNGNVLKLVIANEGEIEFARFCGSRKKGGCLLLNGDGFEGSQHTELQTRIRHRARKFFKIPEVAVIPYAALSSAGIDLDSIRPIQISGDTNTEVRVDIPDPRLHFSKDLSKKEKDSGKFTTPNRVNWVEFTLQKRRYRYRKLANGIPIWQTHNGNFYRHIRFSDSIPEQGRASIEVNVHRLGSTIFKAIGPDKIEHSYISAFDENETTPMYYLAQLPDGQDIKTYKEAIESLAPPIVHEARKQGRDVKRQGDVFVIETNLKLNDLPNALVYNRNDVVLSTPRSPKIEMYKDTSEEAKSGVMIYGTGHTATTVVKLPNGVTYAQGTLYHDPALEEAGRRREHKNVSLSGKKLYLCVRNTVPKNIEV